jgi:dolichyl-phosphate-mannose--protein O-mannosyl transferase
MDRILYPALLLVLALLPRVWGIGQPSVTYFDEHWYAYDAYDYLGGSTPVAYPGNPPAVRIEDEQTWVHPPLGKWLIAMGEGPLGFNAVGWRLPSVVFGVAGVMIVYAIGWLLWRSRGWAALAAGALALDGLHIVQSRMAMLDIFLATFVSGAFLMVVLERRRGEEGRIDGRSNIDRVFGSPYRLATGALLGAAVATKWSGAFPLLAAIALSLSGFLERPGEAPAFSKRLQRTGLALIVVPIAAYLASYWQFFAEHGPALRSWLVLQWDMARYMLGDHIPHGGSSPAFSWPFDYRPVTFLRPGMGAGSRYVLSIGNPIIWWGFLIALPIVIWVCVRRRRWEDWTPLAAYAACYLPWLAFSRTQYVFYMLPAVPFMCLCIVTALRALRGKVRTVTVVAFSAATITAAALFMPVWLAIPVSSGWLHAIRWLPSWR